MDKHIVGWVAELFIDRRINELKAAIINISDSNWILIPREGE